MAWPPGDRLRGAYHCRRDAGRQRFISLPSVAVLVGSPAFAVPPGAGGCGGFFSRPSRVCGVGSWGAGQGYDSFPGRFVFGEAWPGAARRGMARRGKANTQRLRRGRCSLARQASARQGGARPGTARQGKANTQRLRRGRCSLARLGMAGLGWAGQHTVPSGTEDFKNYERTNNG